MMQIKINKIFMIGIIVAFISGLASCGSVDTKDEDMLISLDDEELDFPEDADEFSDFSFDDFDDNDTFADFGSESMDDFGSSEPIMDDFAFESEVPETPPEQDFFSEPIMEDSFAQEDFAPLEEESLSQESAPITPPSPPVTGIATEITDIRYVASQEGGSVIIEGNGPLTYQTRVNSETQQFVIEVPGVVLPDRLKRPYLMKEFGGPFGAINAYQSPGASMARVIVQMAEAGFAEPRVEVQGNSLVVIPSGATQMLARPEPQPAPSMPAPEWGAGIDEARAAQDEKILGARSLDEFLLGNNKFYGRPISLQVKDASVRDVLNFIADESGANLIISDDVVGRVSLKLREIPWDQALVTVLRARALGYVRQGNVIRIASLASLRDETQAAREIIAAQKELSPLRVRVIPVSFADTEELIEQVTPFLTPERGHVVRDRRTSSLIVTDTDKSLEKINRLVRELDIPPAQVMIEGKIVEAAEDFSRTAGINWGFSGVPSQLSSSSGYRGMPINARPSLSVTNVSPEVASGSTLGLGLQIGTFDVFGNLNASLSLAERDSLVRILSSPRIVTMNKEQAQITQQGEQVTVSTTIDNMGTRTRSVQRDPLVLDLTVTPQITADGSVIMDVQVQRQFAGALVDQETLARAINSRSARTKILVRNGQTAVIGGIYQSDSTEAEEGVPYLRNIPVLGWLFKSRAVDRSKNELLIFLTPRILNNQEMSAGSSAPASKTF